MSESRARDLFEKLVQDGETAIDEMIAEKKSEELFLDFKASADCGSGNRLNDNDRASLAKAISGFGNTEGGVIVWGVDCRPDNIKGDLPEIKKPIEDPQRFISWLEGAVSGCTLPPHVSVQHSMIRSTESRRGFIATHIPASPRAPLECIIGKHSGRFYLRAGSNFEHVPYGVLAGMFGRRPTPTIGLDFVNMEGSYSGPPHLSLGGDYQAIPDCTRIQCALELSN